MSYPPDPNNPYGQPQQPQQPGYGYPQQQPQQPQQPAYGYPQQPPVDPYAQAQQQQAYGYPQQPQYPGYPVADPYAGYVQNAYASWGSRVAAKLIDFVVVGLLPLILYIVGAAMSATSMTYDPNTNQYTSSGGNGFGVVLILLGGLLGLAGGLWLIHQEGTTGQTIGKRAVNIRVVREADGQYLGFGGAFVRQLAHFLDGFVCYLGYLWPLWDAKSQTFADKVMNTVVVKSA
ncbi:putative RDD family membrane protein YckC [Streptacidiphilus sp. MAP12-33]|uniref:RDD family protein n=1 Tax=Streptacidiphilus sp. MAP12-33 TaxID=3156266 RepID=UPI003519B470